MTANRKINEAEGWEIWRDGQGNCDWAKQSRCMLGLGSALFLFFLLLLDV